MLSAERQRMLADLHAMGEMINSVVLRLRGRTPARPRLLSWTSPPWLRASVTMRLTPASPLPSPARVALPISCSPIPCERAISNLLDNALRSAGTNATVHVARTASAW